jgi:hypothetical protein
MDGFMVWDPELSVQRLWFRILGCGVRAYSVWFRG